MRCVVQRVKHAEVSVNGEMVGSIQKGLLVFLGVGFEDRHADAEYLVGKVVNLRIFEDEHKKMNRALTDTDGEMLVVSQFTLFGDCRKGRRPSFGAAADPQKAQELYDYFVAYARARGIVTETGTFQAMMDVTLTNDGPVTILIDSKKEF